MVLIYDYVRQKRWWQWTKAPPLQAISVAMAVRWCNTAFIAQCSMTRASPEATERCHWVTTHFLLPRRPPGQQATINTTIMQNVLTLLVVLMAIAMRRYYTARIARWRRLVAFIKANKRCHWASTHSDRHQSDMPTPISGVYFIVKSLKKSSSCPNNNRGVTHQTDEKHLNNMSEYFVGVVEIAFNCYNNRFVLRIINHYLLKYI